MTHPLPLYVLVTGTSTSVGKTIATAGFAAALSSGGWRVAVVKPVQTGVAADEPSDAETVRLLTGLDDVHELASLPDPLAPDTAARLRRIQTPRVGTLAEAIALKPGDVDIVLIEGAGGVLVRLDTEGGTLLDLAGDLRSLNGSVIPIIVTTLALGTLNHTELTVMALRAAGLPPWGLVIGSRPSYLGLVEECNLADLPRVTGSPLLAEIPAGAGSLAPEAFRTAAATWFWRAVRELGPPPPQR